MFRKQCRAPCFSFLLHNVCILFRGSSIIYLPLKIIPLTLKGLYNLSDLCTWRRDWHSFRLCFSLETCSVNDISNSADVWGVRSPAPYPTPPADALYVPPIQTLLLFIRPQNNFGAYKFKGHLIFTDNVYSRKDSVCGHVSHLTRPTNGRARSLSWSVSSQGNIRRLPIAGLRLRQRLRRWPNLNSTMGHGLSFEGPHPV